MANRFLNNIRINDEYTLPANDGSAGQAIVTDGSGNLSFGSAIASSAESAESIHITVKNTSGAQITKGTPVYITGETGNSGKIEVAPADASDSAKMPAVGILESTLNNNAEGFCVQGGLLGGLSTATIDGTTTTVNDTVYVKSGGGLTMTRPTGSDNLIQNIAKVARTHASNGSLVVSSILRTNDVPNLPTGKIWVGDGNTTVSTVVHLDETNGRMGIGTTSPSEKLDVNGRTTSKGFRTYATNTDYNLLSRNSSGNATLYVQSVTSDTNQAIAQFNYGSATANAGQEVLLVAKDNSYFVNTNVGIGTTSPTTKLNVSGNISVSSGNYLSFIDSNLSYNKIGRNTSVGGIQITTGASATMNLLDNGNVGIGTTSPGAKLEIESSSEPGIRLRETGGTNYYDLKTDGSIAWFGDRANNEKNLVVTAGGGAEIRTNGNLVAVKVENQAPAGSLYVKSTTGNVGIGTTSPSEKLEVSGNVKVETLIATDLTDGYVPYSKSGTLGLQDSKIYTQGAGIGVGTTTLAAGCHITSLSNISATGYRVSAMQTAPAARNSTGTLGEIRITSNYIYVCYATNSWSRVALATSW